MALLDSLYPDRGPLTPEEAAILAKSPLLKTFLAFKEEPYDSDPGLWSDELKEKTINLEQMFTSRREPAVLEGILGTSSFMLYSSNAFNPDLGLGGERELQKTLFMIGYESADISDLARFKVGMTTTLIMNQFLQRKSPDAFFQTIRSIFGLVGTGCYYRHLDLTAEEDSLDIFKKFIDSSDFGKNTDTN